MAKTGIVHAVFNLGATRLAEVDVTAGLLSPNGKKVYSPP